jgi:hypothetical protein
MSELDSSMLKAETPPLTGAAQPDTSGRQLLTICQQVP